MPKNRIFSITIIICCFIVLMAIIALPMVEFKEMDASKWMLIKLNTDEMNNKIIDPNEIDFAFIDIISYFIFLILLVVSVAIGLFALIKKFKWSFFLSFLGMAILIFYAAVLNNSYSRQIVTSSLIEIDSLMEIGFLLAFLSFSVSSVLSLSAIKKDNS